EKTGVKTVIVDEEDRIMDSDYPSYITKRYRQFVDEIFPEGANLSIWEERIGDTGWKIINIIDQDVYLKNIYLFTRIVFFFAIGITFIFFTLVFLVSRKYIGTISKIAKGIGEYGITQGEAVRVDVDEKDELYVIARQFNQMTRRVNALVNTLKHKNREIQEAVTRQKHAEIKALEAQINPHFLFNTLDSINWRAIEHEEEEISDMIGALGSLLRYSISNIDTVVVLEAEISWLRKYIFLQRDRFYNSFDSTYDIQEEALSFPIYKMLMQPIVENIILHAFENVREGGMIFVQAYIQEDGCLYMKIKDNGSGITEEKLADIRKEIEDGGPLNGESIGISNVINRLRIYYRGDAKLEVESVYGEGTEFVMIIPNIMKSLKERDEDL
ncbi:MAG TPA: sensor histidine kinase, partial [Candidatus Pelethocola excrementipullorum]|nr:sensor histidine kinase [Candidatus Pelethocola excrementipullorum]